MNQEDKLKIEKFKETFSKLSQILLTHFRYRILFPGASSEKGETFRNFSKSDNKKNFLKEKFKISSNFSKNLKIKKNYVLYEENPKKKRKNQKVLVVFSGNGISMHDILLNLEHALENYKEYDNVMFINYPANAFSEKKVIDYGYNAIKDLINTGYKPENIDVIGHSIGGAVSANVLQKLVKEDGVKVGNYVNINSFSKISKVLPFAPESMQEGKARKALSVLSSAVFAGFELNAEKILNDKENSIAENMTVISAKGDEVIDEYASLSRKVENENVNLIKNDKELNDPHNEINLGQITEILSGKSK
jgi:hypothetical protein